MVAEARFALSTSLTVIVPSIAVAPCPSVNVNVPPAVSTGGSFTAVTVIVNVIAEEVSTPPFAVPPSSCSCTVTVAVPFAFGAGVNVNTPAGEIAGCVLNSALLLLLTMKLTTCVASFGPALMAVAHGCEYAPLSSLTVTFGPAVKVGTSFTGVTVMVNVCDGELAGGVPLSVAVTVIVAFPNALAAGVNVRTP